MNGAQIPPILEHKDANPIPLFLKQRNSKILFCSIQYEVGGRGGTTALFLRLLILNTYKDSMYKNVKVVYITNRFHFFNASAVTHHMQITLYSMQRTRDEVECRPFLLT